MKQEQTRNPKVPRGKVKGGAGVSVKDPGKCQQRENPPWKTWEGITTGARELQAGQLEETE